MDVLAISVKPTSGVTRTLNANVSLCFIDDDPSLINLPQHASATLTARRPTNATETPASAIASRESADTSATSARVVISAMRLTVHLAASASTTGMTF